MERFNKKEDTVNPVQVNKMTGIVRCSRNGAYIRDLPNGAPIGIAKAGDEFPILMTPDQVNSNWYKICYSAERHPGGKVVDGYIRDDLLVKKEPIPNQISPEG